MTPLHLAANQGHLCVVECLINHKADINAQASGYPSGTPLHFASYSGHLDVVIHLVNQKADINSRNDNWKTPLGVAYEIGNSSIVEFLKINGGI